MLFFGSDLERQVTRVLAFDLGLHLGLGAAVGFALVDEEVLVGEGGDLRQVGHTDNLMAA